MASRDLNDAEPDLVAKYQAIKRAFETTFPKYELRPTCTYRSPAEQLVEFDAGRSAIDGTTKLGKHNYHPSRAIDIGIFAKTNATVPPAYLDDLIEAATKNNAANARAMKDLRDAMYWVIGVLAQQHGLRWGGDWRDEGTAYQRSPIDPYHVELRAA